MNIFNIASKLIKFLAYVSGLAILLMMFVTVIDVSLRFFNSGIKGAYDLVRACVAIAITCGLPYLTAVKGHIAIEFFYHKLGRPGRIIMDIILRLISIIMFSLISFFSFKQGLSLFEKKEVFPNLGLPIFWISIMVSISCILMIIIFIYHLLHPGKEYIKP